MKIFYILFIISFIILLYFLLFHNYTYELFTNLFNSKYLSDLKLKEIETRSPNKSKHNYQGRFKIYLSEDEEIIYKEQFILKELLEDENMNIEDYKSIIYNLKNIKIINKYIYKPEYIYIKDDGSYYSYYIKNSIRIYDLTYKNKEVDKKILNKIIDKIKECKNDLKIYKKENKLFGDWNTSNLLYNIDDNRLYNIDYEGFALYSKEQEDSDEFFDKIIEKLNSKQLFSNDRKIAIKKIDNTQIFYIDDKNWGNDFNKRFMYHEPYSNTKMAELLEKLPNNSYIIDVGAHTGDTGLYLALILKKKWNNKNIKVIMIEPDITKINFINKIAKLNKLDNIITKNYSVSDKVGYSSIRRRGGTGQAAGAWQIDENNENNENIKMDTIDNICKNMYISMIHIDVEGMEYKTLLGSKNTLKNVKFIMIELNKVSNNRGNEKTFLLENNFVDISNDFIKKENMNHLFEKK